MIMARMLRQAGEEVLPLLLLDPPPPPFQFRSAVLADGTPVHDTLTRSIDRRLDRHHAQGDLKFDIGDSQRKQAAIRVAMAFERALSIFQVTPYNGVVHLLASTKRLSSEGWGDSSKREAIFAGETRLFEVEGDHREVFDVHHQTFSRQLTASLRQIRELATRRSATA
jgi:thioesterase domain-containing protein